MDTPSTTDIKPILIIMLFIFIFPVFIVADPPVFKDDFLVIDTVEGANYRLVFPLVSLGGNNVITQVNLYDTLISPWEKYLTKGFQTFDLNGNQLQPYEYITPFIIDDTNIYSGTLSIPHSNKYGYTIIPLKAYDNEQYIAVLDSIGQLVQSPKCLNCDNPYLNNHYNEIAYGNINNNSKVGIVWYTQWDLNSPQLLEDSVYVVIYDFETDSVSPMLNPLALPLPEIDEPGYLGDYRPYAHPRIAIADDGSFVVAWVIQGDRMRHLFYVVYNADFTPRSEVKMADCSSNWSDSANCVAVEANYVDVAIEPDGDFYIAWSVFQRTPFADVRNHVWARGFYADGSPKYDAVRVNDSDSLWFLLGDDLRPYIACDDVGNVLVSWADARDYPGNYFDKNRNVYAQKVDLNGNLIGLNSQINNINGSHRTLWHSMSMINSGQVLISWENNIPDVPQVAAQLMAYDDVGTFVPGDITNDRSCDISDLVSMVDFIFLSADNKFWPREITNFDGSTDGATDISDLVFIVDYIFLGGPAPVTIDPGIRPNPGKFDLGAN